MTKVAANADGITGLQTVHGRAAGESRKTAVQIRPLWMVAQRAISSPSSPRPFLEIGECRSGLQVEQLLAGRRPVVQIRPGATRKLKTSGQ